MADIAQILLSNIDGDPTADTDLVFAANTDSNFNHIEQFTASKCDFGLELRFDYDHQWDDEAEEGGLVMNFDHENQQLLFNNQLLNGDSSSPIVTLKGDHSNGNDDDTDDTVPRPPRRRRANDRERDRTLSVNGAFTQLRSLIPTEPVDRKLSKIETLRLASSYIEHLATQLHSGSIDQMCVKSRGRGVGVCTFCLSSIRRRKRTCRLE